MRLKVISVSLLLIFLLSGCVQNEQTVVLDKAKAPTGYEAAYLITTDELSYTNVYTVTSDENIMVVSSKAEEPWNNGKEGEDKKEGTQFISTVSRLDNKDRFGMPLSVEQEFYIDVDESYYTKYSFTPDYNISTGFLEIKRYAENSETGFTKETHSISLKHQFYDKDSLPFIISAFPENEGVIYVSSGNRDSLQRVRYEFMAEEVITAEAGTFNCKVVRLRPDTDFAVNSARVYFDKETGVCVKVVQASSQMELKELKK